MDRDLRQGGTTAGRGPAPDERRGVAVFVVVMVAAVIGVFVVIVTFHRRAEVRTHGEKRDKVQALYLAKGAHNHFLLKFNRLPSELYDAVSYAIGKNPHFDFAIDVSAAGGGNTFTPAAGTDPDFGPMFFTGGSPTFGQLKVTGGRLEVNRSGERDGIYANAAADFPAAPENRYRMEYLLNHYTLDIATDYPDREKGIVVVSSREHDDVAQMGVSDGGNPRSISDNARVKWRDPFIGTYFVQSLKIMAIGGVREKAGRKYQSDTVQLTTEASIRRDRQVSVVSRVGDHLKPLLPPREIRSKIKQGAGWTELEEQTESEAEYARRAGALENAPEPSEAELAELRRTEIYAGVYYVTRETNMKK